ncbi:NAD(P)H-dependent oxidoreductase subunit E, partial [Acinetobacter baumannii]
PMDLGIAGKNALVCAASKGLGRACAEHLAQAGVNLTITARGVEALAAALPAQGRVKIETVYCLGLCSVGPTALVGSTVHARLDAARL